MKTPLLLISLFTVCQLFGQHKHVKGRVLDKKNKTGLEYCNVFIVGTNFGSYTNYKGEFELEVNENLAGKKLVVTYIGYESDTLTLEKLDKIYTFNIKEVKGNLNELVVTGTRTNRRRLDNPVAVNVLDRKTFDMTQSVSLSDGLCFQPGLRMETDCQTCNYTQLRMNGLGGAYSQILINSRPLFTSIMGLYGLEQIPASMIERVEVVRGGGSVLYGSNAIAGTVNIITSEPDRNSFTISNNTSLIDGKTLDNTLNINVNSVNADRNAGVSIFGSNRHRDVYDANGDGYSEISRLKNNSFGFKSFVKPKERHRLELNGWAINEDRQGGNKNDNQPDKADQSEYRLHYVLVGDVNYTYQSENKKWTTNTYVSGQHTKRTHYTGIDQSDGWGTTKSHTIQGGTQLNYLATDFLSGKNNFTIGFDHQNEYTKDEIKAYNYLIDQEINLSGMFLQSDWDITPKWTLLTGIRANKHSNVDDIVLTPRINLLYKMGKTTQIRGSYARGFKAPQAFESDLHIAFAGGGISLVNIDPNLKEETSNSFNLSFDFNKPAANLIYGFTIDAFYTRLFDAFVLEEIGTDAQGNQQLLRKNGGNSTVSGTTLEGRLNINQKVQLETGFTFQRSEYDNTIKWSENDKGRTSYLRTPDLYGFYTLTLMPESKLNASLSGVITGPMLVPHFAGAPGVAEDEVITSKTFVETNLKLSYTVSMFSIRQDLQLFAGVQNIFNEYQNDFDTGKDRDSNFIYGPARPRTFFFGIKFGLL